MKKIETDNGLVYAVEAAYWAGEHSFTHFSNMAVNAGYKYSEKVDVPSLDLWAVDTYNRTGLNPLQHCDRFYIWSTADAKDAANEAIRFVESADKVLITHIVPLNDRLREPATF